MSRLARKPVKIPSGVTVRQQDHRLVVRGPKGSVEFPVAASITVAFEDDGARVSVEDISNRHERALMGLTVRLLANACAGVLDGFEKTLEVQGIGYKVSLSGRTVVLDIGYSHDVRVDIPEGLDASVEKNTLTVRGVDKQAVGAFAASLRMLRPPEPYKGKGIRYLHEVVRRKAGKAAKAAGAKSSA